jgi:polyisoprenyl-teichoic acid--peptidoglycan teichoic acid transferase
MPNSFFHIMSNWASKLGQSSIGSRIFSGGTFVSIALLSGTVGSLVAVTVPLPGAVSPREGQKLLGDLFKNGFRYQVTRPVNVLVLGVDRVLDPKATGDDLFTGHSDSMLLVHVNPQLKSVNVLSIPRDTQVEIPNIGITKINQANASGGPALVGKVVTDTFNGVPVDRYVRFSTDAFRELIDQVGGVRVYVPIDMVYEDKTQKLSINLKQGWQTLNGDQAEQFARFRNDGFGDIGRVQRQQTLLKSLKEQMASPFVVPRIPGILQAMQKYVDTNLSLEEMSAILNYGLGLDQKAVKMVLLPGRFSDPKEFRASYWIMDDRKRDRIMTDFFEIADPNTASNAAPNTETAPLRIAIQNASSKPKAAEALQEKLAKAGYEGTYITEPWSETQTQTQIILQTGKTDSANSIQQAIGIGLLETSSTGDLDSDITIRIGDDFQVRP